MHMDDEGCESENSKESVNMMKMKIKLQRKDR